MDTMTEGAEKFEAGRKLTVLQCGMALSVTEYKVRDWPDKDVMAVSEPRKRKAYDLRKIMAKGAILLDGWGAGVLTEGHRPSKGGFRSFLMDGTARIYAGVGVAPDEAAAKVVAARINGRLLANTLKNRIVLVGDDHTAKGLDITARIERRTGGFVRDDTVPRARSPFTPADVEKLKAAWGEPARPLVRLFMPEGVDAWLACSMSPDGEEIMAVVDLGAGCVEYGPVSMEELLTARTRLLGQPVERDKFFDAEGYGWTVEELTSMSELPAGARKTEEVAP